MYIFKISKGDFSWSSTHFQYRGDFFDYPIALFFRSSLAFIVTFYFLIDFYIFRSSSFSFFTFGRSHTPFSKSDQDFIFSTTPFNFFEGNFINPNPFLIKKKHSHPIQKIKININHSHLHSHTHFHSPLP